MKNHCSLLVIAITVCLFGAARPAKAQLLTNGSFEANASTIGSGKVANGFGTITGWQNVGTTASNSGVQYGSVGTGLNNSESGNYFAFQDSDDGSGANGGAFQLTNTVLEAGDQITLTWYAVNTYNAPIQNVDLLEGSSPSASFASVSVLTPINNPNLTLSGTYTEYTLEYTATAADDGKYLGVSFTTTGAENSFAQYDNFVLTDVSAAVPEPSTCALLGAGLGCLIFIVRTRRSRA